MVNSPLCQRVTPEIPFFFYEMHSCQSSILTMIFPRIYREFSFKHRQAFVSWLDSFGWPEMRNRKRDTKARRD